MYNTNHFKKYTAYKKRIAICEFELYQAKKQNNVNDIMMIKNEIQQLENYMAEIKSHIDNYSPSDNNNENEKNDYTNERLFLRCRYVDGMTMEKTAELLNVSRNTVYRIKKKIDRQLSERLS